jgi:hypothetical protein
LLDVYARHLQPEARVAFGQWALDEWLRHDQRVATSPEELALVIDRLMTTTGMPREYAEEAAARHKVSVGTPERGVLALASSFGGPGLVAPVRSYLTKWYGNQAAQCNCLLTMLAWNESPAAIQYLTSVSRRFRTASIQKKASDLVSDIALRNGWTRVQLADRSIPDGGLDERGRFELCYLRKDTTEVTRTFLATLSSDGALQLADADGSRLKALPEARKDEDEPSVKLAKQQLNAAKKEIKTTFEQQTSRLFDAMCSQRSWRYEEWERFFRRHPIMGRLAARVIWRSARSEGRAVCFRPMEDGSLMTANDQEPQLDPADEIRLAHSAHMDDNELRAWREHRTDFDLVPLFSQIDRPVFAPSDDQLDDTSIEQFRGHVLESFALRRLAEKRGFDRGPIGDGQVFDDYRRVFPDIGVVAVLEFSGNSLPEISKQVALKSLSLAAYGQSTDAAGRVMLRDVPAVLLSECYNDVAEIAAAGSGFDPDWQRLH